MYFISLESAEGDKFKYLPFKTVQVKVRMFIVGNMDVEVPSLPTNSGIGHVILLFQPVSENYYPKFIM